MPRDILNWSEWLDAYNRPDISNYEKSGLVQHMFDRELRELTQPQAMERVILCLKFADVSGLEAESQKGLKEALGLADQAKSLLVKHFFRTRKDTVDDYHLPPRVHLGEPGTGRLVEALVGFLCNQTYRKNWIFTDDCFQGGNRSDAHLNRVISEYFFGILRASGREMVLDSATDPLLPLYKQHDLLLYTCFQQAPWKLYEYFSGTFVAGNESIHSIHRFEKQFVLLLSRVNHSKLTVTGELSEELVIEIRESDPYNRPNEPFRGVLAMSEWEALNLICARLMRAKKLLA